MPLSIFVCIFQNVQSAHRSILSKSVDEAETGKVFALASSAETAAKLIGSIVFSSIYSASMDVWHGLAYLCLSLVYMGLIVLMVRLEKFKKQAQP